jgi:hypothetical protein
MGKILKRCSLCQNFHASYLIEDPKLGKLYLCYDCWKEKYAGKPAENAQPPKPGKPQPG